MNSYFGLFQSSNGGVQHSKIHPASSHPASSTSVNSAASAAVAALSRRSVPDYTKSVERLDSLDSGPARYGHITSLWNAFSLKGDCPGTRGRHGVPWFSVVLKGIDKARSAMLCPRKPSAFQKALFRWRRRGTSNLKERMSTRQGPPLWSVFNFSAMQVNDLFVLPLKSFQEK